jgi:cytochrome P450
MALAEAAPPHTETAPLFRRNLYRRAAILNSFPDYQELRDLGPVVWLSKHNAYAVGRYEEVKAVLKADADFISSRGIAMNNFLNSKSGEAKATLITDGELHHRMRRHLMAPLRPNALPDIKDRIEQAAHEQVGRLVGTGTFEGMTGLAQHLPLTIVAEMVGLTSATTKQMLAWSEGTFNLIGTFNWRSIRSIPALFGMMKAQGKMGPENAKEGTWISRLYDLRDKGEISTSEATGMIIDYIAPSLDTTILATGHLLNRLAQNPEQWERLKADPSHIPGAVAEAVRIDSVIRGFSRVAARGVTVSGTSIPQDARVLVLYASANRDERHFENPDEFDIGRNARDHVGFGHGVHTCAGNNLARLEMESLLKALVDQVDVIKAGPPKIAMNNTLYGFSKLPLELVKA